MNFEEFKKLATAKSFVELYQHYFHLFLISKGYFSKNLSYHSLHEICRKFCDIMQFPSNILENLQARDATLDEFSIINSQVLELMSQISEDDIINAFSKLVTINVH